MRGLGDIFQILGMYLPPWAVAGLLATLLVLLAPAWVRSMRIKQIKGRIRRMIRADAQTRLDLQDDALALAGEDGHRLVMLAIEARKMGQKDLFERGMAVLARTGKNPEDLARLRKESEREKKVLAHPVEVEVVAERLLGEGALVAALERVDEGLSRFPEDPGLRALRRRIDEARGTKDGVAT